MTVPIVVALGYYFGEHLDDVRRRMHQVQYLAAAGALLLLAGKSRSLLASLLGRTEVYTLTSRVPPAIHTLDA